MLKVMYYKNSRYSTDIRYNAEILILRLVYVLSTAMFVHTFPEVRNFVNLSYDTRCETNCSNTNINLRFIIYLPLKIHNIPPINVRDMSRLTWFDYA